jgi:hypothetical protein
MRYLILLATFTLSILFGPHAWAQGTGAAFPTPSGQLAPGAAVLVPTGPIVNGQPVVAPPTAINGVPVTCTNCSPSAPTGASSNPSNGTIAVTNTFQSLIAQNSTRKACSYQNQGTHTMYFSVAVSPTLANSFQVPAQWTFNCTNANVVITDAISITGTSGDAFSGSWQ